MKKYFILIACIFSPLLWKGGGSEALAQKKKQMDWKDKIKLADQLYEAGSYYNAIDFYNEVFAEQSTNAYVANQLAELSFLTRDYKNAEQWYQKTMKLDAAKYPLAHFRYAMSLKMQGKYDAAKSEFTVFSKNFKDAGEQGMQYGKIAKNEIAACDFAMKAVKNPLPVRIEHLNTEVNAAYSDFAAVPFGNDMLVYSSLRSDSVISVDNKKKEKYLTQIFQVKKSGNQFSERAALPPVINDGESHNGNGTFSLNGKKFYFTRCDPGSENPNKLICAIYVSEFKDGTWQEPATLPKEINNENYTTTHPAIGTDGTGKEVLYFASDRPEGQGGMDLWYSVITKDGYKEPKNLGKKINTSGNEITPFYDKKMNALYFSSDGLMGLGGYDIFKSEGTLKKMTPPENQGVPLNSSVDDMYFALEKAGKGYLTSNRPGSIALKSETCCDDIFWFEWVNMINVAVRGYVFEATDTSASKTPIEGAAVSLHAIDKSTNEDIVIGTVTTGKSDMYFFDLSPEKEYKLSASKQGYFSGKGLFLEYADVSTKGLTKSDTLRADLYLRKMQKNVGYVLKNIYYDFDKATLRPESKNSLDSLLMLLNEHPEIKIELGSHTDSKGSDEYNIKLSQKRAESVVLYLIGKGIPKERLVAKGYGETQPVALNENPDGSDNPEGRQLNRRTEFKIIGEVPVTILSEEVPEEMKVKKK